MQTESNEVEGTLAQVARAKEEARSAAKDGGASVEEELPGGSAPVVETKSEVIEEAPEVAEPEEETLIRIGDQTFKTQAEAIKYAESLVHEKEINESYNTGVREALRANAPLAAPEPEENFDEKFYSDPKGTLKEVKSQAKQEALAEMRAELNREKQWGIFFDENPDLAGSRELCESVLQKNWDTLGKMTDTPKAMKLLAQKTRAIFDEYIDRKKPRVELSNKSGQVVSPSGGSKGVTPSKKEEGPVDFVTQMKRMKR